MSKTKLNLIAAACENMGIGIKGTLPWRLKKEMAYFTTMTSKVKDPSKINAVIMGRRTWDCIPDKYKPLTDRVNIVMTHQVDAVKEKTPESVIVVSSLDEAISYLEGREDIESTWVIGGSSIYQIVKSVLNSAVTHTTLQQQSSTYVSLLHGASSGVFRSCRSIVDSLVGLFGKAAMEHSNCGKIYLTEIQKSFDCDTFFPNINKQIFHLVDEEEVPGERQIEGDISYYFRVYKKL